MPFIRLRFFPCLILTLPFLILSGFNFLLLNKFLFAAHSLRRCFFFRCNFVFNFFFVVFFLFVFVSLRNHFVFFFYPLNIYKPIYEHTFNYIKSIIVYRSDYAARVSIASFSVVIFSFSFSFMNNFCSRLIANLNNVSAFLEQLIFDHKVSKF